MTRNRAMTRSMAMTRRLKTVLRWLTYNSVGIMGTGVQLVTLVGLTELLGLDYLMATGLAVETAILHNFCWHERWTWRDRIGGSPRGRWGRLARFNLITGTLSITGNAYFTGLYATSLGVHYAVANLMAIASMSLMNFVANDRLVFRALGTPDLVGTRAACPSDSGQRSSSWPVTRPTDGGASWTAARGARWRVQDRHAHPRRSSRNSEAGSTPVTSRRSRARVQAT